MTDLSTPEIRAALPPRSWPYTHKIDRYKYIGFRKLAEGGTWLAKLQMPNTKPVFHRLGDDADYTFLEAMAAVLEWFNSAGEEASVAPSKLTVRLALSQYLTYRHNEKSLDGYESTKSLFDCHVFPHPIAAKLIAKLDSADLQAWLNETGEKLAGGNPDSDPEERKRKGHLTANQCWAFFKAALNRATKTNKGLPVEEWRGNAVEIFEDGETVAREAFITEVEAQRLVNAASSEALRDLTLGGLLTGARIGELKNTKVRDFNPETGKWTPSSSKSRKNGRKPRVLDRDAVTLFVRLCTGKPKDALIFTPDGENWRGRYEYHFKEAARRAGLESNVSFYSLRHSYVSRQVKARTPLIWIAKNIGTSIKQLERHYSHIEDEEKRELLAKGTMRLDVPESKVVNLR
jgi:integrase